MGQPQVANLDVRVVATASGFDAVVEIDDTTARQPFSSPFQAGDLDRFVGMLAQARDRGFRPRVPSVEADPNAEAKRLGQALFDAVFRDQARDLLAIAQDQASRASTHVRIRLKLDGVPDLVRWPWELLCRGNDFLVLSRQPFLARYVDVARPLYPVPLDGPLRILVVAASPRDLPPLEIDEEYAGLEVELGPLRDEGRVVLDRLSPPTFAALQHALREPWHVLHFMGHGDQSTTGGLVALCDDGGNRDLVEAVALGRLLGGADDLRLAVLNGCRTAAGPTHQPLNGVAYQLMQHGAPAAVAMQFPVGDRQAVRFARAFYDALADGGVVDLAMATARRALVDTPEWVTPVLFLRSDGRLFDVPAPPDAAVPAVPPPTRPVDHVPPGLVPHGGLLSPRPWLVRAVATWLDGPRRLFLLTGDLGTGKSVLCGWLAGQGELAVSGDVAGELERIRGAWSAVHFCSASLVGASTDPRSFVLGLNQQLVQTVPGFVRATSAGTAGDLLAGVTSVDELFERAVEGPLRAALATGGAGRAVLLVDGLDEAEGGPSPTVVELLGRLARLDVPLKLLLSGPDDEELLETFTQLGSDVVERVDLSSPAQRPRVDADVRAFVDSSVGRAPGDATAPVDPDRLRRITVAAAGSLLYAEHAVEQLLVGGSASGEELPLPADLASSYEQHLRRTLERELGDHWREGWVELLEPLLGCLAVARAPVPGPALETWLGWTKPQLWSLLDRFQQLIHADGDCYRVHHPAFAQLLLAPSTGPGRANPFRVDQEAANRRLVETACRPGDAGMEGLADRGGSYTLVYLPSHLGSLMDTATGVAHLDRVAELVLGPAYVAGLRACVDDPVLMGRPFRDLAGLLLAHGRPPDVERLVRFLAGVDAPAVRASVFDVLLAYAEHDETAAGAFMGTLALGGDAELAATALHATCRLSAPSQARVFRRVVDDGDDDLRVSAAYALYANGSAEPARLTGEVLKEILAGVSLKQPWRLKAPLEFFTHVTVTNYVNNCGDPAVAQVTSDLFHQLLVDRLHVDGGLGRLAERVAVEPFMAHQLSERVLKLVAGPDGSSGQELVGAGAPGAEQARRVVPALDPQVPLGPLENDLGVLLDADVALFRILGALTVAVHGVHDPVTTGPIVERLFAAGAGRRRRWLLLAHAVVLPDTPTEWIPMLERMTRTVVAGGEVAPVEDDPVLQGLDLLFAPLGLAYAKARRPMVVLEDLLRSSAPADLAWRAGCLHGLGVVGLHHPDQVFTALDRLQQAALGPSDAVPPLALMAGLHPLRVRAWAKQRGEADLAETVQARTDVQLARRYLEVLGLYNNAVHQAVHYPRMRNRLCMTVFSFFLDAGSRKEWSRRYTREGLSLLREADYELIAWTRPE